MKNLKSLAVLTAIGVTTIVQANTSGNLFLKGNVPEILNIQVNAEAQADSLDLESDQNDLKVATVQERSNNANGYTVSIDSANDGNLVRSGGSESFAYSMKYDGASVDLSSTETFNNSAAAAVAVNKDVTISYTGQDADTMVAGDYQDTVTFSISAN